MTDLFDYQDTITMYEVSSGTYSNSKSVVSSSDVPCVFLQNTQMSRSRFQDSVDSDAVCYVDPLNSFVQSKFNRLEGMYILAPLFGAGDSGSWYKVTDVIVNRDHLLGNEIDNIELRLKKSVALPGVS